MRLLVTTDLFPTEKRPNRGIFMVRQAKLLEAYGVSSSFLITKPFLPKPFSKLERFSGMSGQPLKPSEFDVEVLSVSYPRPPGEWFRPFEGFSKSLPATLKAVSMYERTPFDAVLGVDMTSGARSALTIGKRLGIPTVSLAIGSDVMTRTSRRALSREISTVLSKVDLALGVSDSICQRLRELCPYGKPPLRVYLGRREVERPNKERKSEFRNRYGFANDSVYAIFAGRLSEEKGIPELVEAFEAALLKKSDLRLVCLGEGPLKSRLLEINRKVGRSDAVVLPGLVKPEDVHGFFAASDFLVFPSRSEGLPQVVLEAMDAGLPVIATRVGGIPEIVVDDETGILVDVLREDQLTNAVSRMARDKTFREAAGAAGYRRASTVFDSAKNSELMAQALFELKGTKHLRY